MALPSANENAFLGVIVGVAIGDALGLPIDGESAEEVRANHGNVTTYLDLPDMPEGQPTRGVISDQTEIMLSMVESMTTNEGIIDPENIIARLGFIIESPSRQWMSDEVVRGVQAAIDHDGQLPEGTPSTPEVAILVRGIPVGLAHSIGELDRDALVADAVASARLTHADAASARLIARVAEAVSFAARYVDTDEDWRPSLSISSESDLSASLDRIIDHIIEAETFEDAVLPVIQEGGDAAAWGAVAGGIAGARFGAAGLPQELIDDLDARIYLSMAAPWFYRTIMHRYGQVIDLTHVFNPPPM